MRTGLRYYETSMAETYRMAMAETYLRRYREPARGGLTIQAVPPIAQVFVDGHYVGLAEEFGPGGGAIMLNDGAHRVELRAPDYETLTFSVKIEPNGLVRYRGDMQRIATKPADAAVPSQPAPAPAPAKSFYVIPNCYAGDKPPSGALPKGCDIKKLQTRNIDADADDMISETEPLRTNSDEGAPSTTGIHQDHLLEVLCFPVFLPRSAMRWNRAQRLCVDPTFVNTNRALPAAIAMCCLPFTA